MMIYMLQQTPFLFCYYTQYAMLFSNFGFRKYFVMPKMLYSVVILYYVIISVIIEKITLQYCGKTQCK